MKKILYVSKKVRSIDLHGYTLDEANGGINLKLFIYIKKK